MTLTEQWKKGELEYGYYYVDFLNGKSGIKQYGEIAIKRAVKNVKAHVPSYEEWQELSKQRNQLIRDIKDLAYIQEENAQLRKFLEEFNALEVAKENQQLKELLKEVRDAWVIYKPYDRNQLCKRIDNAIGEKK